MANKVYIAGEASVTFGSEATETDWSTESIANGAGRQSAQYDRGIFGTSKAGRYHYRFYTQFQATPTLGAAVYLYAKTADTAGTAPDNDDGTGDAAVSAIAKLDNLQLVDVLIVDEAAANIVTACSGTLWLWDRYVQFVFWNASGATITTDVSETKLILTPVPDEIQ